MAAIGGDHLVGRPFLRVTEGAAALTQYSMSTMMVHRNQVQRVD